MTIELTLDEIEFLLWSLDASANNYNLTPQNIKITQWNIENEKKPGR